MLASFGSVLVPLGRCWFVWVGVGSFGSVLASFGSVLALFGSVLVRLGWCCLCLDRFGSVWVGLDRFGSVWVSAGLVDARFNCNFPNNLKLADITATFKAIDPTCKENYRPISVLPVGSKLSERIMQNKLFPYVEDFHHFYVGTEEDTPFNMHF